MKANRAGLLLVAALVAAFASPAALADRGHRGHAGYYGHGYYGRGYPGVGFGIYLGGPAWWGPRYYYPPPYYYYPPPAVVAVPATPPVYIERGDAQPAPEQEATNWWYYCANPSGYYPYVKQCPGGWQRVSPQPPPG